MVTHRSLESFDGSCGSPMVPIRWCQSTVTSQLYVPEVIMLLWFTLLSTLASASGRQVHLWIKLQWRRFFVWIWECGISGPVRGHYSNKLVFAMEAAAGSSFMALTQPKPYQCYRSCAFVSPCRICRSKKLLSPSWPRFFKILKLNNSSI